ncbi:hypothetical protein EJP82_25910 [Paenibacillus anaericanus]|uniref:Uncharacterized protein n=1 Tax=Paenibacillus anaericanus TaxID=170367 RepID=A0A433XXD4_9BACL|nr:hypothetical protein [Paenibacillus anaericanus]RUT39518.1 hypothetical protein EJP82_25910 [Paenibacillus anaericanus]
MEVDEKHNMKLSLDELAYLVAFVGGTTLRGIQYSFNQSNESELRQHFELIQQKLENKDILHVNFDGTVQMSQDVHDMISTIAFCNRVILQQTNGSEEAISYQYYLYGELILELQLEEDQCILHPMHAIYELNATMIERSGILQHYDFGQQGNIQDLSTAEIEKNISSFCSVQCCHLENEQISAEREVSYITSERKLYQIKVEQELEDSLSSYSFKPVTLQWVVHEINQIL